MIDEPRGAVIGAALVTGTLHSYDDGRQQGPRFYGASETDVREQALCWYAQNGGRAVWPAGLELRLRP